MDQSGGAPTCADSYYSTETFCAMFDILGLKALRRLLGTEGLSKSYRLLLEQTALDVRRLSVLSDGSFRCEIFSDTIVFLKKEVSHPSFLMMLVASQNILKHGFENRIPLRGAIGYGDLSLGNNLILGESVEDAYEGEQQQVWSGCMLTKKATDFINASNYIEGLRGLFNFIKQRKGTDHSKLLDIVVQHDIPRQKNVPKEYYAEQGLCIDWTPIVERSKIDPAFLPGKEPHHCMVLENTIAFWERARRGA